MYSEADAIFKPLPPELIFDLSATFYLTQKHKNLLLRHNQKITYLHGFKKSENRYYSHVITDYDLFIWSYSILESIPN